MKADKQPLDRRKTLPFEIAVGVAFLAVIFFISVKMDMASAESRLYSTVQYMKEQCNASQLHDLASESKSLLRVSESVSMIRDQLYEKVFSGWCDPVGRKRENHPADIR